MTIEQPPSRVKILTRLRIDEVGGVDQGAGEGVKVVLMKRANDSADADHVDLSPAEISRAKVEGYQALRHAEQRFLKEEGTGFADHQHEDDEPGVRPTPPDDPNRFLFSKETFLRKTYAATASGDSASREDEATPVDELDGPPPPPDGTVEGDGGNDKPSSTISGLSPEVLRALSNSPRALALMLAVRERFHKNQPHEANTMTTSTNLMDIAKREGVHVIAKIMAADQKSNGVSQDELVAMISDHERQDGETAAKCFSRHYEADTADGLALRKAVEITKNAPLQDDAAAEAEKDATEAMRELVAIGKSRWPSLTPAQQFARSFECNPELAKRAHRRPSVFSTSHPFPSR